VKKNENVLSKCVNQPANIASTSTMKSEEEARAMYTILNTIFDTFTCSLGSK